MEKRYKRQARGLRDWGRIIRFGAIGVAGVAVNTLVLLALTQSFGVAAWQASPVATETAIISNFLLNDAWTFRDLRAGSVVARFARYNGVALGGMLITVAVLSLLTRLAGVELLPANLAAVAVATAWNYVVNRRWTWGLARSQAAR